MILTEADAKKITDKALALSKAESCEVSLFGSERGNVRFALNSVTTSGYQDSLTLRIESNFGKRSGSVTLNELDEKSIEAAVRKSEELAKLAPENAEFMPPLGKQVYPKSTAYFEDTARVKPEKLAQLCAPVLTEASAKGVTSAGYIDAGAGFTALATSAGLFVYEKNTDVQFTVSARTDDGTGSGWAGKNENDLRRLDTKRLGDIAVSKTIGSQKPVAVEPGKYTVILESSAVCDLIGFMLFSFDARSADEGRSFLTKKSADGKSPDGKPSNKLGEKLFGDRVTISSDPNDDLAPGSIFSTDGLPSEKRVWVENGVVKHLITSRYWAEKTGTSPVPFPTNLVMQGGSTSTEEMIRSTKKGILVTRLWYIRTVDPRTLLLTGLTRDGAFLIEDGKITKPVKNFRFNESPISVLNNIEAMGKSERTRGSEIEDWSVAAPALLVKDFTFSSLSDAV